MSTSVKVAAFVMALVITFLGARAVGSVVGPDVDDPVAADHDPGAAHDPGSETTHEEVDGHGDHDEGAVRPPGGLAVSRDGYTLRVLGRPEAGADRPFRFVIEGPDGHPVTSYDEVHDRPLHLVKVRRDFSGYEHVHPTMADDGTWRAAVCLTAGSHRVFADFTPSGGPSLVLGTDVELAGDVEPAPAAGVVRRAHVGGYAATLRGSLRPGEERRLVVTISHRGEPVTDLQPYLGAHGHLVALREGDLGYLHVHPLESEAGPEVPFLVEVPSPGDYRLFLDFKHEGVVRTAELALTAEAAGHDH